MNSNSSTTSKRTTNSKSINTLTRTTDSTSKNISSTSSNKKKTTPGRQNSLRCSTADDVLAPNQRLSLSPSFCNAPNVSKTTFPIHSLVEGSLEYREMKRLYLGEKQQTEEWRKDCNVLKRQVAYLKSSTILYVRGLHRNLNFTRTDMRKAIGTSIRSATCELRKIERHRQHQLNSSQDDENVDSNESDLARNASNDMEIFSDGDGDITDPDDDVDDFDNEDDGASEKEDLVNCD
ncbi:unnamed protein product [Rotaria socialis]|uniref:Uncharacterized protein n=1 Tax=Rotaria socialis TaxID=392032 RepID=A0A821VCU2_9BILA|nr:unnamed protein product [Rotaria socialis]CAF4903928.1 unnamed protein product [Rotaria socialis]